MLPPHFDVRSSNVAILWRPVGTLLSNLSFLTIWPINLSCSNQKYVQYMNMMNILLRTITNLDMK